MTISTRIPINLTISVDSDAPPADLLHAVGAQLQQIAHRLDTVGIAETDTFKSDNGPLFFEGQRIGSWEATQDS